MLASLEYDQFRPLYSSDLSDWVSEHLPGGRVTRAVDVGCGTGRSTRWVRSFADEVIGVDSSEEMVVIANQVNSDPRVEFCRARAESFADQISRSSLVVCGSAFEWFDKNSFQTQARVALSIDGQVLILWSWIETLDDISSEWYSIMRRLLGAQVGPDPNDAMAMAWTFFNGRPSWTVKRTQVGYSRNGLAGLIRSSSYWRPKRPERESLMRAEVSRFSAKYAGTNECVNLTFREVGMIGAPP